MPPDEADSPFTPSPEHLQRIRERAYHLWESEGRPEGQADEYWERARELDALEFNSPTLITPGVERALDGAVVDEASLQENLGEFPGRFTDQGDTMATPETKEIAREYREGER